MKITAVLLLGICLQAAAAGHAQKITYSARNVSVNDVLTEVKKQTGYGFVCEGDAGNEMIPEVDVAKVELDEFLKTLLSAYGLNYVIHSKTIFVRRSIEEKKAPTLKLEAPPITVRGRVVNEKGEPVTASIIVKGTSIGVSSDNNGYFEIDNVDGNAVLIISGVGIETQERGIAGKASLTINVTTKIGAEEEVTINAGYYKTNDKMRIGNIGRVAAKDIERQPVTSPLMALQGRIPGVEVTPYAGIAGSAPVIRVRGINSLRPTGNYPLYIIDGVPIDSRPLQSVGNLVANGVDPLSSINPANIASIEVLKDADATAIYGSRGANGVILITTKNANNKGKTDITLNASTGIGTLTNRLKLMNREQYLAMRNEAFKNDGTVPDETDWDMNGTWDTTRSTDWQDLLLGGNANVTDVQIGILGGNKNTSFRVSAGYHKENTIYPGDFGYHTATGAFNLNHSSSNEKFKANLAVNYGANNNKLFSQSSFVLNALFLPPTAPALFDDNGDLNWQISPTLGMNSWNNPYAALKNSQEIRGNNLTVNSVVSYAITSGINAVVNLGFTQSNQKDYVRYPIAAFSPTLGGLTASALWGDNERSSWIVEPQLNYSKTINDHSLNVIIGLTAQESRGLYRAIEGGGYTSDAFIGSLLAAPTKNVIADDDFKYRYGSVFSRIAYNYKEKYLLSLTGRRDVSSRFGPGNRFANFGSVGAAWIFSEESWFRNSSVISFGKLRGSYGTTGNDQIGDYQFISRYSFTNSPYQDVSIRPTALFNPDFAWEVTRKMEVGIDVGLLNNRISFSSAWYRNRSSNQLVPLPLPGTVGFASVLTNQNSIVQNTGWEFQINTTNIQSKNFRWSTSANLTIPRNKLVKLDKELSSVYAFYKEGEPLSIQYRMLSKGVNPETGLYEFEDVNKDGIIDFQTDRVFMKPVGFKHFGGINNNFTYKNFELSFLIQFSSSTISDFMTEVQPGDRVTNQQTYLLGRWQKTGDVTAIQKFTRDYDSFNYSALARLSDLNIADVTFFRLKTLSLAYNMGQSVLNMLKMKEAKIFLQGQNLFTISNFKKTLDPETGNALPPLRIIMAGVQLKF